MTDLFAGIGGRWFDGNDHTWASVLGNSASTWDAGEEVILTLLYVKWHYGGAWDQFGNPSSISGAAGPFAIDGSNDTSTWTTLLTATPAHGAYPGDFNGSFGLSGGQAYRYYRWRSTTFSNNDMYTIQGYGSGAGEEGENTVSQALGSGLVVGTEYILEWEHSVAGNVSRARLYVAGTVPPDWQVTRDTVGEVVTQPHEFSTILYNTSPGDVGMSFRSMDFFWADRPCYPGLDHTILDTFEGRTEASGWGTASSGLLWEHGAPEEANHSVASGKGLQAVNAPDDTTVADIDLTSSEYADPFSWPAIIHERWRTNLSASDLPAAPGTAYNAVLSQTTLIYGGTAGQTYARYEIQHYSRPVAFGTPNGYITFVRLLSANSPSPAQILDLYLPLMFLPDVDYEVKCYVYPGQPLKLKAWVSGATEPDWMWTTSFNAYGDPVGVGTAATNPRHFQQGAARYLATEDLLVTRDFTDVYSAASGALPTAGPGVGETISGRKCSNFDGGTSTFNLHHDIWVGTVEVFVNGVFQNPVDMTATTDGLVTLSWTTEPGDNVRICYEIRDS